MANELVIPPDIKPDTGEEVMLVDDQTFAFRPQFGRGWSQRNSFGDPRWRFKRAYRGMRMSDRARMLAILAEAQGGFRTIMVSPAQEPRGTWKTSLALSELFTNADFSSGTNGWSHTSSIASLSVSDGIARLTATDLTGSVMSMSQSVSVTQYAPHVVRSVIANGRGSSALNVGQFLDNPSISNYATTRDYRVLSNVTADTPSSTTYPLVISSTSAFVAGDYLELLFASMSRCALVDGRENLLLQSDDFATTWANVRSSDAANSIAAPNGTTTADSIIEDGTAAATHYITQSVTVASAAADICLSVCLKAGTRSAARVAMQEDTGPTEVSIDINLSTGALSGGATGANWANRRTSSTDLGNGWWRVTLIARKTNAATSIPVRIYLASAVGTVTYSGDGASLIYAWRASISRSSVATFAQSTTTTAAAAADQSGSAIHIKGLPASTSGLLLVGDWVEIDGQLKMVTAALDSDAAGLGYLQVRPKIVRAVADNTPVIVTKPMGRFVLSESASWNARAGLYAEFSVTLDEVYE